MTRRIALALPVAPFLTRFCFQIQGVRSVVVHANTIINGQLHNYYNHVYGALVLRRSDRIVHYTRFRKKLLKGFHWKPVSNEQAATLSRKGKMIADVVLKDKMTPRTLPDDLMFGLMK